MELILVMLVTFFLMIQVTKQYDDISEITSIEWFLLIFVSILFPIGLSIAVVSFLETQKESFTKALNKFCGLIHKILTSPIPYISKDKKVCSCGKPASWVWTYGPKVIRNTYACDDCVPRGCSCNMELKEGVEIVEDSRGTIINPPEDYEQVLDNEGRMIPCREWVHFENNRVKHD